MIEIEYDETLVRQVSSMLDLRRPNAEALDAIARKLAEAPEGAEIIVNQATGVGKTYVAGGLLDYLQEQGVRNVVIITPGSTIQRKTVANLTPGHAKFLRGLQCKPVVVTLDDVETGTVGQALVDDSKFKVFVLTVQSLLRPDTKDNRRAHTKHEVLGSALSTHLANCDDLIIISDEHHTYFGSGSAKRFQAAIKALKPQAVVGLTATPHEGSKPHIVHTYPLAAAIADGYVKIPVLVARQDGKDDLRTQMADGVALLNAKDTAMRLFTDATGRKYVRPVMFVVAESIDEASRLRDLLCEPELIGSEEQVLLVTSDQPNDTLAKLDELEDEESPVRVVVSVSMLKEGWDVKNIFVVAAVRALQSDLLTEQILGRGLRLPFSTRTGVGMLDTVEVLSHSSFADLLEEAQVFLEKTLGERASEAMAIAEIEHGVAHPAVAAKSAAGAMFDAENVLFVLPGPASADTDVPQAGEADPVEEQGALLDLDQAGAGSHGVGGIGTVTARLAQAHLAELALKKATLPTKGLVPLPLFVPRVDVRVQREAITLSSIGSIEVEGLGRKFATDNSPSLRRTAVDVVRKGSDLRIGTKDLTDEVVTASQEHMPFDTIQTDLVGRLMRSNAVAATVSEMNAANRIAEAFLRGAQVTQGTPWRLEHGRLASTSLVEWIAGKQAAAPWKEIREVAQVPWPEPPEVTWPTDPTDKNKVSKASEMVRGHPYSGWSRGIYSVASFDAFGTEFRLAELFDSSFPAVKAWTRISGTLPLRIAYAAGAANRFYHPDFIVIDKNDVHWIVEGKRDDEMISEAVIAKKDATVRFIGDVNDDSNVSARWGYLLASESIVRDAGTWAALKAAAQTWL